MQLGLGRVMGSVATAVMTLNFMRVSYEKSPRGEGFSRSGLVSGRGVGGGRDLRRRQYSDSRKHGGRCVGHGRDGQARVALAALVAQLAAFVVVVSVSV